MKFPKEASSGLTEYYYKIPLNFLAFADFEAMNKKDNTMKGKLIDNIFEQVPVSVTFHKTSKLGNPSYLESFDKNCVGDFVGRLLYL